MRSSPSLAFFISVDYNIFQYLRHRSGFLTRSMHISKPWDQQLSRLHYIKVRPCKRCEQSCPPGGVSIHRAALKIKSKFVKRLHINPRWNGARTTCSLCKGHCIRRFLRGGLSRIEYFSSRIITYHTLVLLKRLAEIYGLPTGSRHGLPTSRPERPGHGQVSSGTARHQLCQHSRAKLSQGLLIMYNCPLQ